MAEQDRVAAHNAYNQRLIALAQHRQKKFDEARKIIDSQRQEVQAKQQAMLQEAKQREAEDKKNWFDEGAQGASMGAAAGPWGALIGAVIGTGMGMYEAIGQRREEGEGMMGAIGHTIFDAPGFNVGEAIDQGSMQAGLDEGMKVDPMQAAQVGVMAYQGFGAGNAFQDKPPGGVPEGGYWDPAKMNVAGNADMQAQSDLAAMNATSRAGRRDARMDRSVSALTAGSTVPKRWEEELAGKKDKFGTGKSTDYDWEQ